MPTTPIPPAVTCNVAIKSFFDKQTLTPLRYLTCINGKRIFLKQDYLNHPYIQGNKLRKLKYTLLQAAESQQTIISFGGAYSNHIAALAAAGKAFNLPTVGIIRGAELADKKQWGHTLQQAHDNGMTLYFVRRNDYREKHNAPSVQTLINQHPKAIIIPEGGSNTLSLQGTAEIIQEITQQKPPTYFQQLFAACGTGGTLAGLIDGAKNHTFSGKITGIACLKGADFLAHDIQNLSQHHQAIDWHIEHNYHAGGYAKITPALRQFIEDFQAHYNIPIEPIYTGKLCHAVFDLAKHSQNHAENWLIYHSGGLQGTLSAG